ncbi:MAG: phosphatase PAP2 family protein [Bacteroidales bacterium]|nr:phosphatase PAP2 family protein [Bacteroidales bacterium]
MIDTLKQLDTELFRWVNSHHCTVADWVLWVSSQHWFWAIVLVLFLLLVTLRVEPRRWWIAVVGVTLCFLLADQGSVHLFKETVQRLRPCHVLDDVRMFHTHCGGRYGFVSSHAANAFAILTFLWLRYRKKGVNLGLALMALWAVTTCYSRAYLGKHFPGDLVCGALFGIVIGLIVWTIINFAEKKFKKIETK